MEKKFIMYTVSTIMILFFTNTAMAGKLVVPYVLGPIYEATEVNANFTETAAQVTNNNTRIKINKKNIAALEARIAALEVPALLTNEDAAGTYIAMGQDLEVTRSNAGDGWVNLWIAGSKATVVVNANGTCSVAHTFNREFSTTINGGTGGVNTSRIDNPQSIPCTYTLSNNVVSVTFPDATVIPIHMTSNGQMGIAVTNDTTGEFDTIVIVRQP